MTKANTSKTDVSICEVGPRDGLQNESAIVPTAAKLELVERLVAAGLKTVEVTSFVSPKWIPQLADADALVRLLPEHPGVEFSALVPNAAGYERFRAASRIDTAEVFISASETHNRKNVNRSVDEHLERLAEVFELAASDGVSVRAYVSTVCGCPDEGVVSVAAVVKLAARLIELGASELSLGDTIGVGTPRQVQALVRAIGGEVDLDRVGLHLHDTYGRALANVWAGFEVGIRRFDSSLAGLGGCPYAPGASGNIATEDVVDFFERSGICTGVDLDALVDTASWVECEVLERPLSGRVYRAELGVRERAGR